jgi:hypothetical protein
MAFIDEVYVLVEKEDLAYDVDITEQPVERSIDITDHVQRKAVKLSISGLVAGPKAANIHRYLADCQNSGKIVSFTGRTTLQGLLSGLSTSRDYTTADGFTFSVTITEVLIANSLSTAKVPPALKPQVNDVKGSGLQLPREK